ncbi:MAG: hypothetical protein IPP76_12660 [Moraxellaceae bacterium]|nr:hypothetical protein [Moraxellaceae bacterium]
MNKLKLFAISVFILCTVFLTACNKQESQQKQSTTTNVTITPEKALIEFKEISLKIRNGEGFITNVNYLDFLLSKMPENSKEYSEAKTILKEIEPLSKKIVENYDKEQKEKNEAQVKINAVLAEENRVKFAQKAEYSFLDNRLNVTVTTLGKKQTTLKLKYSLMNKVFIHEVMKSDFTNNAKKVGFKSIIFTNGYDDTWTLSLDKT